ncbi:hypothetical protein [Tychonema sp. LEGE 07203]|uniref:hypothetical protein n=1 Tax=Tychonema sp. LEGE 07203 TaxID=1828671 RepID=UPI00187F0D66|nr:hypothetical protein [Tychonema sp. LEGE 07203]MBE9093513.1 hypothetical protein [Tychonema sp. LEGE 07203]
MYILFFLPQIQADTGRLTVTSAIARSNSPRYLLGYQDAIAPQYVIQSRGSVTGSYPP